MSAWWQCDGIYQLPGESSYRPCGLPKGHFSEHRAAPVDKGGNDT